MELILLILFVLSVTGNVEMMRRVVGNQPEPIVRVEYKEIEVIKKAICECDHPSSMHDDKNGCNMELFNLDGHKTTKSFKCFCVRYVGPEPVVDFFDREMRELETRRVD